MTQKKLFTTQLPPIPIEADKAEQVRALAVVRGVPVAKVLRDAVTLLLAHMTDLEKRQIELTLSAGETKEAV